MERKPNLKNYSNNFSDTYREPLKMEEYIQAFRELSGTSVDNIQRQGSVFHRAVEEFTFDAAVKAFQSRFPEQSLHNWDMLDAIGQESCDPRVFFLPRHMHTMRFLKKREQENLFEMKNITIIRSIDGKETVVDIGKIKSSEWNVLFDKDKRRLRSHLEQKEYVRSRNEEKILKLKMQKRYEIVKGPLGPVLKIRMDVHSLTMEDLRDIFSQIDLGND